MGAAMNAPLQFLSRNHQAAHEYAAKGYHIFPCAAGTKRPATPRGVYDATTDPNQIDSWWGAEPNCNVAIAPDRSGCFVLDVDAPVGIQTIAALEVEHGLLPATLAFRTPRGGFHYWFKGSIPSTVGKIGAGVDTRGQAGYVLVPPSRVVDQEKGIDGTYSKISDAPMAEAPEWIVQRACAHREKHAATVKDLDLPGNIERARSMLRSREPAYEKQGADARTYEAACACRDLGLSATATFDLMLAEYRCEPRDARFESFLHRKIENAYQYGQNEPGAWAVAPLAETFGASPALANDAPSSETARTVVLRSEAIQDQRQPPQMLIEGWLPAAGTVGLHASFGSYKSFIATDAAMSVASGRPAFGHYAVLRSGPVICMAGEGLSGFETLRRPAWRIARNIAADTKLPIFTVDGVPQVRSAADVKRYLDAISLLNERPVLIVIDPVARSMAGLNENDARDAGLYLEMVEGMAKLFACCVLSIMHEGKDESRGARGSSAFAAGLDNVWRQEADTEATTVKLTPVKLKDDAGIESICLKGRQIHVPRAGKSSLVFDWMPADEFKGRGKILARAEIGRALVALRAVEGKTVTTRVLATELAGPDADEQTVLAIDRRLRRARDMRFRAYVAHQGEGRGDATLWTLPKTENDGAAP